jgi:hypothetical protein
VVSVLLSKIRTVYVQLFTSELAIALPITPDCLWHQSTEYNSSRRGWVVNDMYWLLYCWVRDLVYLVLETWCTLYWRPGVPCTGGWVGLEVSPDRY